MGDHPLSHLGASAVAALVNYPLWKASAIRQSGFKTPSMSAYLEYRGAAAVVFGMTWARAAIFFGSDYYKIRLKNAGFSEPIAIAVPPLLLSSVVQCINMPIVRASITMQNPETYGDPRYKTTFSTLKYMVHEKGIRKLWHGLSAGLAKSVPKYMTSVVVKDWMENALPQAETQEQFLVRAATKSVFAGLAGAVLTNPMDVIRNEMFKTDQSLISTTRSLNSRLGFRTWSIRGLYANLIAVSVPITLTIFLTDILSSV